MEQISIGNIKIDIVKKRIKNIYLSICPPDGNVRISAPYHVKDDLITTFVVSKLGWIKKQRDKFAGSEILPEMQYKDREIHYYKGGRFLLNIIETDSAPEVIILNNTNIDMYVNPDTGRDKRHKIMQEWYRKELKRIIPDIIKKWESIIRISVSEWNVRQMKTKWGSVNLKRKRVLINLELIKKPVRCLEYVMVHEMVHLLEHYHNDRFKAYMDRFLPDWRQLKEELNRFPAGCSQLNTEML